MKTFFALCLLIPTVSAFAACPQFSSQYTHCSSTDRSYQVGSIKVSAKEPFYRFWFVGKTGSRRLTVVTDGEPRDITVQTQEGSESTYTETSSCHDEQLLVLRVQEETPVREMTVFSPSGKRLDVSHYVDGGLKNITTCYAE